MFFLLPIYTNYLGVHEYGIVESMTVFSSVLSIIFSMGLYNSVYRLYYDYKTEEEKKTLFGTITAFVFLFSVLVSVFLFLSRDFANILFDKIPYDPYFKFAIVITLLNNLSELPKSFLMIQEKALEYTLISIVQFLLNTGFAIYFIIYLRSGADGVLSGQLISSLLISPFFIIFSIRNFGFKLKFRMLKSAILFSLPALPTLLSAWILNLSDRVFIDHYINPGALGVYSLGYKIASIIVILFTAIDMSYLPKFFKFANIGNSKNINKLVQINRIYIVILLFISFLISFFSKEVILIFFSKEFYDAHKVVMIISYGFFLSQTCSIISKNLSQSKKVTQGMYIDLSSAGLNIVLNILLIPVYGILGAAWATLLSFLFSVIVYYYYSKRNTFFVKFYLVEIGLILIFSVFLLVLFNYLNFPIITSLVIKFSIVVSMSTVLFFIINQKKGIFFK
jgi:O-antigen/teichoic acid export membrane protein